MFGFVCILVFQSQVSFLSMMRLQSNKFYYFDSDSKKNDTLFKVKSQVYLTI